jgi:3-oxoisoapionate decarboxylase
MQIGISSYSYGWTVGRPSTRLFDEDHLLVRAERHRVGLLQICDNISLLRRSPNRLARFAARAARQGVRLETGGSGLTVDHLVKHAALARAVGASFIRFVIDGPGYHPSPAEVNEVLRESLPALDGLQLGLENHDRFPAIVLRRIVEDVGSDRVGICLDTANSIGAGEGLETVVRELAHLTLNLHLKDFVITRVPHLMGFTVEGRPAGKGMLDVRWLLDRLEPFQRCQTAVLELWTPPEATADRTIAKEEAWVSESLAYLRPYFDQPSCAQLPCPTN